MHRSVGLDFGTTNSAIGVAENEDAVTLARFTHSGGVSDTFRSILYFHPDMRDSRGGFPAIAGPRAIESYLNSNGSGRLIQSLKSFLADRSFESTNIFGRVHSLTSLMSILLRDLRARAEEQLGPLGPRIVVGRPVHFSSSANADDDAFAVARLRKAIEGAGWEEIIFEYEPVAAAYYYESRLDHDEIVLVADFGGGTSDFSIIEAGPNARRSGSRKIYANDGIGLAGDALDAKILHNLVAPFLGLGTTYRSMFNNELPVPVWLYAKLRRWHLLSFLKSKSTLALLAEIEDQSNSPDAIRALRHVIDYDLGYHLYRSVERSKVAISSANETIFEFADPPVSIEQTLSRLQFEGWIADETQMMSDCVDRLLAQAGVSNKDIDRVFMTGGTSFVPVVHKLFADRFGEDRIRRGGELISVATGLSLRAREGER